MNDIYWNKIVDNFAKEIIENYNLLDDDEQFYSRIYELAYMISNRLGEDIINKIYTTLEDKDITIHI